MDDVGVGGLFIFSSSMSSQSSMNNVYDSWRRVDIQLPLTLTQQVLNQSKFFLSQSDILPELGPAEALD